MRQYEPMSRKQHLERGNCCTNGCVHCPWRVAPVRPQVEANSLLVWGLKLLAVDAEAVMTLYSARPSLVCRATMQDRITIEYLEVNDTGLANANKNR